MYRLTYSKLFLKNYKKFSIKERKIIKSKLEILCQNPQHPSLRTKKIQGNKFLWELSVNMDIRIIWYYEGDVCIFLVDVGHHDVLDKI